MTKKEVEAALAAGNAVVRDLADLAGQAWHPTEPERSGDRANILRRGACGRDGDCTVGERRLLAGLSGGERQLVRAGEAAKGQLLELWGRLCWNEAFRVAKAASRRMLAPASELLDDLHGEACLLLVVAANHYDGSTQLSTYATTIIRRGLWERVCRSSGLASCPRDAGRAAEASRGEDLAAEAAGGHAAAGMGTVAVMSEGWLKADDGLLDQAAAQDLTAIFEEAEKLGIAAGVDPAAIMAAYTGDGLGVRESGMVEEAAGKGG
jgi:hypothetical protein